jgi:heme exporter protein D
MSDLDSFLAMGGYAGYVWPAYGVAAFVLIAMTVQAMGAYRRTQQALETAQASRPSRPDR